MRLLIIGATGGTGFQVTSQAVERGYRVTVFMRSPRKLGSLRQRVDVREGEFQHNAHVHEIVGIAGRK